MKWLTKFFVKEAPPGEFKRLHTVRGEFTPGVLSVSLETVNENGEHLLYPMDNVEIKIVPKFRAMINRVLLDEATENDLELLSSLAKKNLK